MKTKAAAYTLMELMIAVSIMAVVLVAALTGVLTLQKSYADTERYGSGMADQARLLDYLAMDLRRAITPTATDAAWTMDADGQGLKINVPDFYRFNAGDIQHRFPIVVDPVYDDATGVAYYRTDPKAAVDPLPHQVIAYRFADGVITRTDPWAPLVPDGSGGYKTAGPAVIAANMDAFPTIAADASDTTGGVVRYNVTFHSTFQVRATANKSNAITLHNVTFIRSKNLHR